MKNTFKLQAMLRIAVIIALVAVIVFSMSACGGGEKSINSADALKAYLDSQPANSADKPIKVAMKINENMVGDIKRAINSAGKYVSLNLAGSPLTTIPYEAFTSCENLVGITIPDGITSISGGAFWGSNNLISVTFQGTTDMEQMVSYSNSFSPLFADLRDKYLAGGPGTYTRPDSSSQTWTKK